MPTIEGTNLQQRKRYLVFAGVTTAITVANWDLVRAVIRLSEHDMTASHLPLIPLVSLVLIYNSRLIIFSVSEVDYLFGLAVMFAGFTVVMMTRLAESGLGANMLSVGMTGVVVLWIGAFVLIFGRKSSSLAVFPLLFLLFSVPTPPALLTPIVAFLKTGSSAVVEWLFALTGTPHYREGFFFTLPSFTIEIADECSGIRSSIALLLTSLLAGHLCLSRIWQKAVLALTIIPIVVIKNGVRIASLCLLATHADPGFLSGRLHHEGGFVFYLLGLAILFPILALLHHLNTDSVLILGRRPVGQG